MVTFVLTWAILGVFYSDQQIWQIAMQNISSICCYLWDITLMFAQKRDALDLERQISLLQASGERKLRQLSILARDGSKPFFEDSEPISLTISLHPDEKKSRSYSKSSVASLPPKSLYDRCADAASRLASSPWSQAIFVGGIIAWLALGPKLDFGNDWQLYVNTATAVELIIMTTFLQNTKRRHRVYMHHFSTAVNQLDLELDLRLAAASGEKFVDAAVLVAAGAPSQPPAASWFRRNFGAHVIVDRYADFVGSSISITLSILLLGVWLALGKVMGYTNSNWWLIIGTYTGLVGFINAFVLRNVMKRLNRAVLACYDSLDLQDLKLAEVLGIQNIKAPAFVTGNMFYRMSAGLGRAAAHAVSTFLAFGLVIGLLATASAMKWTVTAQLICNTPTMILEGGMLLVLMMAHMASHEYMRARLQTVLLRRVQLQAALDALLLPFPQDLPLQKPLSCT
eukprot:jgi/Astpho2/3002/Aster-03311